MAAKLVSEAQSLRILCIDGGGIKGYTALLIPITTAS
jgi:patatin-like phospholipase/acyl hydrolase